MTSCHFRLAGGLLSVMIYWFSPRLLWLDFSFSHSSLLFSPSSSPRVKVGPTAAGSEEVKKKKKKMQRKKHGREDGVPLQVFSSVANLLWISKYMTVGRLKHGLRKKHCTGTQEQDSHLDTNTVSWNTTIFWPMWSSIELLRDIDTLLSSAKLYATSPHSWMTKM